MEPRDSPHQMEFQMQAFYDHIRAGAGAFPPHHQPSPLQHVSPHHHYHHHPYHHHQQHLPHHMQHLHHFHHHHHQQQQEQQLQEGVSQNSFNPSIIHSPAPLRQMSLNPSFSAGPGPGPNVNLSPNPLPNMNQSSSSGMSACYPPETPPHMMPAQQLQTGSPPSGMNISRSPGSAMVPVFKKKRGRPRKYTTDINGSAALPATQNSVQSAEKKGGGSGPSKKKKSSMLGGSGRGFMPHVLTVGAGEDVTAKIMTFSQHAPWTVCILSANGAISNASLSHGGISNGPVTYEGRFEVLSLSGLFLLTENGTTRTRSGGFSVSLAGQDGRVIGGRVTGLLIAATPIQVVMGTFFPESRKAQQSKGGCLEGLSSVPTIASVRESPMQMMNNAHAGDTKPVQGYVPETSEELVKEEDDATNAVPLESAEWGNCQYSEEPQ